LVVQLWGRAAGAHPRGGTPGRGGGFQTREVSRNSGGVGDDIEGFRAGTFKPVGRYGAEKQHKAVLIGGLQGDASFSGIGAWRDGPGFCHAMAGITVGKNKNNKGWGWKWSGRGPGGWPWPKNAPVEFVALAGVLGGHPLAGGGPNFGGRPFGTKNGGRRNTHKERGKGEATRFSTRGGKGKFPGRRVKSPNCGGGPGGRGTRFSDSSQGERENKGNEDTHDVWDQKTMRKQREKKKLRGGKQGVGGRPTVVMGRIAHPAAGGGRRGACITFLRYFGPRL